MVRNDGDYEGIVISNKKCRELTIQEGVVLLSKYVLEEGTIGRAIRRAANEPGIVFPFEAIDVYVQREYVPLSTHLMLARAIDANKTPQTPIFHPDVANELSLGNMHGFTGEKGERD